MINVIKDTIFKLDTKNTSYIFRVTKTGQLENLFYGKKIRELPDETALTEKNTVGMGTMTGYDQKHQSMILDNICLEYSGIGKGDYREPFVDVTLGDGTYVTDFVYKSHKIINGKNDALGNAASYGENLKTLEIELFDKYAGLTMFLYYTVFYDSDIITRATKLVNNSKEKIEIKRIMSMQLDLPYVGLTMLTFDGAWSRERNKVERTLNSGITVNDSKSGASSNRHNPLTIFKRENCTQDEGECYGVNLIYSGNHFTAAEVGMFGKTRIISGINPYCFNWVLKAGEEFLTPEGVMTYSNHGLNGMSQNMHDFIKNNIVRGNWKNKERPVLINSWEAMYFAFDEEKLLDLAKEAADLGIELFVLDDGWFGKRNNDRSSLGDWVVNKKKLPEGLKGLSEKLKKLGLMFGLWVEPEMINEKSDLYALHPEWAVKIDGRTPSICRNQMQLDLTRPEVVDYLFEALEAVFEEGKVDYVKWDYNRTFSDMMSGATENQGEFFHRYILGLYTLLNRLNKRFPDILFESCASGGNRFDLGMLCYMPQTWASDNTDAFQRIFIQEGTCYGYPPCTIGAHVSETPNNQTFRTVSFDGRFNTASFGLLGYELDLNYSSKQDRKSAIQQIEFYKEHRRTFQFGTYYRLMDGFSGNYAGWITVAPDKSEAIAVMFTKIHYANTNSDILRLKGLDDDKLYKIEARRQAFAIKPFVPVITKAASMVTPLTIEEDGALAKNVLEKIVLKTEKEEYVCGGDLLNNAGIKLNQPLVGMGFDLNTRIILDFESRLYLIKELD